MWNVNERTQARRDIWKRGIFSLNTQPTQWIAHCDTEKLGILIDWISSSASTEVHMQLEEEKLQTSRRGWWIFQRIHLFKNTILMAYLSL